MNERIRELALQAGVTISGYNDNNSGYYETSGSSSEELKKFAELIVRECMEQVWYDREAIVSDRISESIKERICQHFGVEE